MSFEPLRHTMKAVSLKGIPIALLATLAACSKTTDPSVVIETAPVERRSIVLSAQANGTVEPVTVVEVKSKASGTIIRMPVDIGSNVKVGDLLVQIDPRDVQNQYDQSAADLSSATVQRQVALAQRNRSADLFRQKIITQQEMEAATLAFANADASVIKARTNLSIARVRLEDATGSNREGRYWRYELWLREQESRLGSITGGNGSIYALNRGDYVEVDPRWGHDLAFPYRMVQAGRRAVYEPAALAFEKPTPTNEAEYARKVRMFEHCWEITLRGSMMRRLPPGYLVSVISHRLLRYGSGVLHVALLGTSLALAQTAEKVFYRRTMTSEK